ncbi:MAG: hypothetical protein JW795_01525, partial [Chitinivibrionales bacterium]|nr:hypothetical protein [Chitinivibrionales bacterium]
MKTSVYHPLQASLAVACHVILTGLSVMVAMVASGCSPLPAIQSARIVNGAGFGIELTPPSHSIEVVKVDTAKIPGDTARFHTRQFTHEQEVFWKGYFRLGFHERVEATFAALPYLLYYPFFIACANV